MMKTATPLLAVSSLLVAFCPIKADYVIAQKVDGMLQSGPMTVKIKDAKIRADIAGQVSTIIDGGTGDSITLVHGQKAYMRVPAERTKALVAQMQKLRATADADAEPAKLTATGKLEKVDKYDCEVFTWSTAGMNVTYWIAKDFPNFAQINAALEKTQNAGLAAVGKGMLPGAADLPGMAMKTEMVLGGQKVTTTIVSVNEENVDAAVFEVPADYKELAVPAFDFPETPAEK